MLGGQSAGYGAGPQGQPGQPGQPGGEDLIAVPAGLWGSLISLVSKGAGGLIGGQTGQTISDIGQTVGGFLPFSTVPSGTGPQGQPGQPGGEDLIAVPAGLWGSLISLVSKGAGGLIGGQTGQTISDIGQTVGGFLPFSTVPSGTGPQGQPGQPGGEDLIAVPAGLWGSLISLVSKGAGGLIGGQTGQTISDIGQTVGGFLPFSTVPSGARPQGQPGQPGGEDLIAVPAGLWGSLISLVSKGAGGLIGGQTGQTISDIGQTVGGFLPFSTVPSGTGPQGQPGQPGGEDLIAVPAGLWGSLISLVSKGAGGLIGGQTGQTISDIGQTVGGFLPFSRIPSGVGA